MLIYDKEAQKRILRFAKNTGNSHVFVIIYRQNEIGRPAFGGIGMDDIVTFESAKFTELS